MRSMKKILYLIILICFAISCQYERKNELSEFKASITLNNNTLTIQKDNERNNNLTNDTTMERNLERYDFISTLNGTKDFKEEKDGWIIEKWAKSENTGTMYYKEYAPASDFYVIFKFFHQNGAIKTKGNLFGSILFGIFKEYDENGYCINIVDEDKKFGAIKYEYIISFLENKGWFNRKTGENKIARESPLKTDGTFYREIMRYTRIGFVAAKHDRSGKEIEPPKWYIRINPQNIVRITEYEINGNTGEYKIKEYDDLTVQ